MDMFLNYYIHMGATALAFAIGYGVIEISAIIYKAWKRSGNR